LHSFSYRMPIFLGNIHYIQFYSLKNLTGATQEYQQLYLITSVNHNAQELSITLYGYRALIMASTTPVTPVPAGSTEPIEGRGVGGCAHDSEGPKVADAVIEADFVDVRGEGKP